MKLRLAYTYERIFSNIVDFLLIFLFSFLLTLGAMVYYIKENNFNEPLTIDAFLYDYSFSEIDIEYMSTLLKEYTKHDFNYYFPNKRIEINHTSLNSFIYLDSLFFVYKDNYSSLFPNDEGLNKSFNIFFEEKGAWDLSPIAVKFSYIFLCSFTIVAVLYFLLELFGAASLGKLLFKICLVNRAIGPILFYNSFIRYFFKVSPFLLYALSIITHNTSFNFLGNLIFYALFISTIFIFFQGKRRVSLLDKISQTCVISLSFKNFDKN